jgi:hypothetical protein
MLQAVTMFVMGTMELLALVLYCPTMSVAALPGTSPAWLLEFPVSNPHHAVFSRVVQFVVVFSDQRMEPLAVAML